MAKFEKFIKDNREILAYIFFGGLTTVINVIVYYFCYEILPVPNTASVIIAWIISVAFSFITNKLFVFDSKNFEIKTFLREAASFFTCRILTGILDLIIMYVTVDLLDYNATLWKIISNVIVVILNYVAVKLFIFKKPDKKI